MSQQPRIREACEADYEALCELWAQADALHARIQPDFFCTGPGLARPFRFLTQVLAAPDQTMLVADLGRVLAGTLHVRVFDTPRDPRKVTRRRGHVEDLVVEQEYRHRGVGRALMEAAAEWCQERGAEQLLLTVWTGNDQAEAFYARLGYRPVNRVLGLDLAAPRNQG